MAAWYIFAIRYKMINVDGLPNTAETVGIL